jgi:DNA repair exonuclease SbcCD ATPase subunit
MTIRGAALPLFLALSALGCQSHPEKGVVDQYFNAVNTNDSQTLASFAAVSFDKKVERWEIKKTLDETKSDAPLPALAQKVKDLEAELANNTKAARAYNNDHYVELDQLKTLKKDAAVPAKLAPIKAEWDKYSDKDRELKRAIANAKAEVEKEKRSVERSIGQADDVETLGGEMKEKKIELDLTIAGQVQPYVMTVRKYDVKRESGPRVVSRWVVQELQPAS